MLEFTHVKAEGPCKLVIHGGNLFYETRPASTDSCSEVAASSTAVGVLVGILTGLLQLVWWACSAVLVVVVIPTLLELACVVGAVIFFVVGWIARVGAACMLPMSSELAARSCLLRSCSRLISYRPARSAPPGTVDDALVAIETRRRVIDLRRRSLEQHEPWQQTLED